MCHGGLDGCAACAGCGLCCGIYGAGLSGVAIGLISDDTASGRPPAVRHSPPWPEIRRLLLSPGALGFHAVEFGIDASGQAEAAAGSFDIVVAAVPVRREHSPAGFLGALVDCVRAQGLLVAIVPATGCTGDATPGVVRSHLVEIGCLDIGVTLAPKSCSPRPTRWAAVTATTPPHPGPVPD